jgi:hypothetical protein
MALEAAIEAHVHDECDGDLTGAWVLVTETTTLADMDNNDSVFFWATREKQSSFMTDGLLSAVLHRERYARTDGDDD